jgi:hypothetical protein
MLSRNIAFKFTSEFPKRHTFMLPSARIRNLLQVPQKCSDIEVINPNLPTNPGIL